MERLILQKNRLISFIRNNKNQAAALCTAGLIISLMLLPNITKCIANGNRFRHLSDLYKIDYSLTAALEQEAKSGYNVWYRLLDEHDSDKLLYEVSSAFFKGKLKATDYYTENDGTMLSISSAKYPEMQTLKIKIPEVNNEYISE